MFVVPRVALRRVSAISRTSVAACSMMPPAVAVAGIPSVVARGMFGQRFQVQALTATPREEVGSRHMRAARAAGRIPGIVYGPDASGNEVAPKLVYVDETQLRQMISDCGHTLENTLVDLKVGEEVIRVLPRQLQTHPFRSDIIRLNFLRYTPEHGARISIPLKMMNEDKSPGLREGGWLVWSQYKLPVIAKTAAIPDFLMVDVRGKIVGDVIRAREIFLNEGLVLRFRRNQQEGNNFLIAAVGGKRSKDEAAKAAVNKKAKAAEKTAAGGGGAAAGGAAAAAKPKAK